MMAQGLFVLFVCFLFFVFFFVFNFGSTPSWIDKVELWMRASQAGANWNKNDIYMYVYSLGSCVIIIIILIAHHCILPDQSWPMNFRWY